MLSAVEESNRKRCTPGILSYQSSCAWRAGRHGASAATCASAEGELRTLAPTTPTPAPSRERNNRRAIEDCNHFPFMPTSSSDSLKFGERAHYMLNLREFRFP